MYNHWEGNKVRLRAIVPDDSGLFHRNDQDSEGARLSDALFFPRSEEGTRQWAQRQSEQEMEGDNRMLAIETLDGTLVGCLNAQHCDPRNGTFQYGIGIFRGHWRNGYGSDAIRVLLRYFFHELRYEKASAHVYAFNAASIALQERLGFQLEGRLRRMIFTNGQHHDLLVYGMLRSEYDAILAQKQETIIK